MSSRQSGAVVLTTAMALLLTAGLYAPTVGYGFYYDDYHFVRPYTAHEVLATFHGPWDTAGVETAYYRPLTICLYAVRFAALGLNARANHVASLALFGIAAALFAAFASRITGSFLAGILGAVAFVVHPLMSYAAVAWVTNQMHLAESIVVLGALLWWFHVRARPAAWWMPLLLFQAVAFLIKEDGIMLVPAILVLHLLRKLIVERSLQLPWAFIAAAVLVGGSLLLVRSSALHSLPSHRLPSFEQAWTNWTRGFDGAFRLLPGKRPRPWETEASWFVNVVPVLALLLWRRLSGELRFAMIAGLAIGAVFVLPFAFIIKAEQLHLVITGEALLLTASLTALVTAFRLRLVRVAVLTVAIAGLLTLAVVAHAFTRDFEPYGPIVLNTDRLVDGWAAVPVELVQYLIAKRTLNAAERPDPDPSRALPIVSFGFHGVEHSPDGIPLRWMAAATADVFARRGTRLVSFSARHERGAFAEPAHVRIDADGETVADTVLDDGKWHRFDVALRQRASVGLSGMHRIRVQLDHAWVPAQIIPGSGDGRTLGLQIGVIESR